MNSKIHPLEQKKVIKIIIKWSILVSLNSIVGFLIAMSEIRFSHAMPMILGILTFIAIYSLLDIKLLKKKEYTLSKIMFYSAIIKMLMQPIIFIDMFAGILAVRIVESTHLLYNKFLFIYFTTIVDGLLLSGIVFLLILFLKSINTARKFLK